MTPEGKVKADVNRLLKLYGSEIYKFMPVPGGFGPSSLDYVLCVRGVFVAIETKKPGGKLTARQEYIARQIRDAGGIVFIVDSMLSLAMLRDFLDRTSQ
jgi:hypothetical protein